MSTACVGQQKHAFHEAGVALPTVLWAFLIIVSLGTIFLVLMSGSYLSIAKQRHELGAYYCAYSGIMYAKVKRDEDPAYAAPLGGETLTLPTGTALITTAPGAGGSLIVTSQGRYGQGGKVMAVRAIRATMSGTAEAIEWRNL